MTAENVEDGNFETADEEKIKDLLDLKTFSIKDADTLLSPRLDELDERIGQVPQVVRDEVREVLWEIEEKRKADEAKLQKDLKDKREEKIAIWKRRLGIGGGGSGVFILLDTMVRLFLV